MSTFSEASSQTSAAFMKKAAPHALRCSMLLALVCSGHLQAVTVTPMQGQTPEQIQTDTAACQTQASQAAPPATTSAPAPQGGRVRGAAAGAAAGAASAQVRGNQYQAYDKLDSDVQQQYRQNQAQQAAAAGAAAGAAQQRQQRRQSQQQQQQTASQSQQKSSDAFNACMSARGYNVTP